MTIHILLPFSYANSLKLVLPMGETTVIATDEPFKPPWLEGHRR